MKRIRKTVFGYVSKRISTTQHGITMSLESQNDLHAVWMDYIRGQNDGQMPTNPTPTFWDWVRTTS